MTGPPTACSRAYPRRRRCRRRIPTSRTSRCARVFVFPVGIEVSDHLLLNLASYPWPDLPGVTMARAGDGVEIVTGSGGGVYRYAVAADNGPHLLLRRR